MRYQSPWRRVTLLLAALAVILAACDGGSGGGTTTTAGTNTTAAEGGGEGTDFVPRVEIPQTDEMQDTSQYAKEPPWTVGYSDASQSNSARVFAWQFTQFAASEYDEIGDLIRTDANDSPDTQVSDIEDLLARGVDCLIIAATSEEAINPAIDLAMSQGVPVVIQERDVQTDNFVSHINIRTFDIGRLQAEGTVEILGGEGNVVLLEGLAGAGPAEEARRGHEEVFAANPGINVLATEFTGWSRDQGKTIVENWLQSFDQIDAIVADSGIQQQGAYEAVEAAGRLDEIQSWTGDSLQAWIRMVADNDIPGVLVNRPQKYGALAVDACAAILAGVEVPKNWFDPVEVIPVEDIQNYIAEDVPGSDEWWDWWDMPAEWLPS